MFLSNRNMYLCLMAAAAVLLIPCGGCGSSSSNPNPDNLTQTQASQLGAETFDDAFSALDYALESAGQVEDVAGQVPAPLNLGRKSNLLAVLPKNKHISSALSPEGVSCTGPSCTITSVVYDCAYGGTITVNGSESRTTLSLTFTPASCSDGTLIMNGNPDITMNAQASDNGTTTTLNYNLGGDVSFAPVTTGAFPKGSCGSNLSVSASVTDSTETMTSCSVSGTVCGLTVSYSCLG